MIAAQSPPAVGPAMTAYESHWKPTTKPRYTADRVTDSRIAADSHLPLIRVGRLTSPQFLVAEGIHCDSRAYRMHVYADPAGRGMSLIRDLPQALGLVRAP